jgi:hypothetical protein
MRLSRLTSAAALAAALSLALASPASAVGVTVGENVDSGGSDLRPFSNAATAGKTTRNANGTSNVVYGCVTNGAGDIVAINVRCVLRVDGVNVSEAETTLPGAGGAASAAANAALSVKPGFLEVCWRSTAYYINGDRKDLNSVCKEVPTLL